MALTVFVLVTCEPFAEEDVLAALRKIPRVKEAHSVYGAFDLLAKVEALNLDEVEETLIQSIRKIPNIKSTLTMISTRRQL